MERSLSFYFYFDFDFDEDEHQIPESVTVSPNPNELEDNILLLTASVTIRALAFRHGLEQALDLVNQAAMGNLDDTRVDMLWDNQL